jgi:acetyl esterase/lipase
MNAKMNFLIVLFSLIIINQSIAQDVYDLWEGEKKPHYLENDLKEYEKESWGTMCVFDITEPTLTVYKAEGGNSGKAVVIYPGGGYTTVALYHEGHDLAKVLSKQGITAAVLKYRLPNPKSSDKPESVPLSDARRGLKLLRENAEKYSVDRDQIGVLGFSAGSHLATVVSLWKSDDVDENPNFSALIYGVTNLSDVNLKWLEESLYYRKLTEEELAQNRLLELVIPNTPPAFLVHAYDDKVCLIEESTHYADRLLEEGVSVEMHLFPKGVLSCFFFRHQDPQNFLIIKIFDPS